MASPSKPRFAFGTKRKNTPKVLKRARLMYAGMSGAPSVFSSPTVSMPDFLAFIEALEAAEGIVPSGGTGVAALRNVRREDLWEAMQSLGTFVQGLANKLDSTSAIALIEQAGLLVAGSPAHGKELLQARLTAVPGLVHLVANGSMLTGRVSSKRRVFLWQWRAIGETVWNSVPPTPLADTEIANLPLMTEVSFRVSVTISRTTGAWTDPVTILVH